MCQATHKALNMQEPVTISIGNRNLLRHVQRLAAASSAVSAFSNASAFGMSIFAAGIPRRRANLHLSCQD
jgi:hypothetical protein